jgi:hypothetical protein
VKIITSTLLNLAQIAIDAVIPTTLTAVVSEENKVTLAAVCTFHVKSRGTE